MTMDGEFTDTETFFQLWKIILITYIVTTLNILKLSFESLILEHLGESYFSA